MPIILQVGRRRLKIRLLIGGIYLLLVIAAVTTVYPFLIMLSNSVSCPINDHHYTLLPAYLYDDEELFRMYLYDRYGNLNRLRHVGPRNVKALNDRYKTDFFSFEDVQPPPCDLTQQGVMRQVEDFGEFVSTLPDKYWVRAFEYRVHEKYYRYLERKFAGDIAQANRIYGMAAHNFYSIRLPNEEPFNRSWRLDEVIHRDYRQFAQTLPENERMVLASDMEYARFLKSRYITIESLNQAWGTNYASFTQLRLPWSVPADERQRADWESFVRNIWPHRYIRLTGGNAEFRRFLADKYGGAEAIPSALRRNWKSLDELDLPREVPDDPLLAAEWKEFVNEKVPIEFVTLDTPERQYCLFLGRKYGTVEKLNAAHGTAYSTLDEAQMPLAAYDRAQFQRISKFALRIEFLVRNYRDVINAVLIKGYGQGRALLNTFVLVVMTVAAALTIDPLCAYALSRYKLRYGHKILIYCLAPMAFPTEVALIPSFLLMKDLHLLNTYWALILPGLANGFAIFLLKGFFDSLPQELYEAATLDGASELSMFWHITIPLCKPIFAVLALGAFGAAYGGFMWAFMICPDPKLWTISVFLYEFQRLNPQSLVMASLILAALPTLIVFLLCQRTILRGIIIPTMR